MSETVFIAIDGDNVGRRLEKLVSDDDEAAVVQFSQEIQARLQVFVEYAHRNGGTVLVAAGDSVLCRMSFRSANGVAQLASTGIGATFSVGIGKKMSEAMLALKLAKARGRKRVVRWDDIMMKSESAK